MTYMDKINKLFKKIIIKNYHNIFNKAKKWIIKINKKILFLKILIQNLI